MRSSVLRFFLEPHKVASLDPKKLGRCDHIRPWGSHHTGVLHRTKGGFEHFLFDDRHETALKTRQGVPESLWKFQKSKHNIFFIEKIVQLFFETKKKFFWCRKKKFKNIFWKIFRSPKKKSKNQKSWFFENFIFLKN